MGVDSRLALAKLRELGEFVKSPSSTIQPPVARKLRAALAADREPKVPPAVTAPPAATAVVPAPPSSTASRRTKRAKPRVHEVAAEAGVDARIALAKLKELGEFVRSPSSTLEPPVARKLKAALDADPTTPSTAQTVADEPVVRPELGHPRRATSAPMVRPRVHEVAAEIGVDTGVVVAKLAELGVLVRSPASAIDPSVASQLKRALNAGGKTSR